MKHSMKKKKRIQKYDTLAQQGKVDLYFFDESGFSANILGFINKQGDLMHYLKETSVKSADVIEVFEAFSKQLSKPTVVVLDNASFHKSKVFKENIATWSNRGLTLLYLPPYSPQLNIIEMLWRFIKYHWMEMSAYESYTTMKNFVLKTLNEYGSKRKIDFSLFQAKKYLPALCI